MHTFNNKCTTKMHAKAQHVSPAGILTCWLDQTAYVLHGDIAHADCTLRFASFVHRHLDCSQCTALSSPSRSPLVSAVFVCYTHQHSFMAMQTKLGFRREPSTLTSKPMKPLPQNDPPTALRATSAPPQPLPGVVDPQHTPPGMARLAQAPSQDPPGTPGGHLSRPQGLRAVPPARALAGLH